MESVNIKTQTSEASPGQVLVGVLSLNTGSDPLFKAVYSKLEKNPDLTKVDLTPDELKYLSSVVNGYLQMTPDNNRLTVYLNESLTILENRQSNVV